MPNNEIDALNAKQEIRDCIKRYKDLYKEAGSILDERYAGMLKSAKNDLAKSLNNAVKDKVFSSDIFNSLKSLFDNVVEHALHYERHLDAIKKMEDFIEKIEINLSPETSLDLFKKAKSEFDNFCAVYQEQGFSKEVFDKFVNTLNVYMKSRTRDAIALYDELKVPVMGLYQMYNKNNLTDGVVRGCIDDIYKVLNKHIYVFQSQIPVKPTPIKKSDEKSYKGFGARKSLKKLEEQEDAELGLIHKGKNNKLKQAVETVLDKKSKKIEQNWVDAVITNVFKRNP